MDSYFTKYEKLIEPNKYVIPSSKNKDLYIQVSDEDNYTNIYKGNNQNIVNNTSPNLNNQNSILQNSPSPTYTRNSNINNNTFQHQSNPLVNQSDMKRKSSIKSNPISISNTNTNYYCNSSQTLSNVNINLTQFSQIDDIKSVLMMEKKKNLKYRYEITNLKNKVKFLQNSNNAKDIEIAKLKNESDKDRTYLLNLEKMITQYEEKIKNIKLNEGNITNLSCSRISAIKNSNKNLNKGNSCSRSSIRKLNKSTSPLRIKNINLITNNESLENNNDNVQNEKLDLNEIDNLLCKSYQSDNNYQEQEIQYELDRLKNFKAKIYEISQKIQYQY